MSLALGDRAPENQKNSKETLHLCSANHHDAVVYKCGLVDVLSLGLFVSEATRKVVGCRFEPAKIQTTNNRTNDKDPNRHYTQIIYYKNVLLGNCHKRQKTLSDIFVVSH